MIARLRRLKSDISYLNKARTNLIDAWPESYYRKEFIELRYVNRRVFILNRPEDIQHVMVSNASNYRKSLANRQPLKPLLGEGLFVSEGKVWSRQRKIANPATHTKRLEGYAKIMIEAAGEQMAAWGESGLPREIDLTEEMTLLTSEVITRCMFSCRLGDKGVTLYEAFQEYLASHGRIHITELLGFPEWLPRLSQIKGRKAVDKFDSVIRHIIRLREQSNEQPDDLLQMLFDFQDATGQPMDDLLLRDEVATIYLAGHETTAIALGWSFYLLHRHPEVKARVLEEIEGALQGRVPCFSDLSKLPLCRAVFEESLRLYPPIHVFSRQALGEDKVGGSRVPKGSFMTIPTWVLHRHEKHWENPNDFIPDRFLPENSSKIAPYTYLPFGAGPRICLGKHFGLAEGTLFLAMFAQNFDFAVPDGRKVEAWGRMTLRPKGGMPMIVNRRD